MAISVTIDRSKWLRGEGGTESRLVRSSDGKMCCLGFCLLAAGKAKNDLLDVRTPASQIRSKLSQASYDLGVFLQAPGSGTELVRLNEETYAIENSDACGGAMSLNDDPYISDGEREMKIANVLTKVGFELTFVDSIP